MKVLTVLGTRPEIIRLSRVIQCLDKVCEHIVLHTGQNYDVNLDEIFFKQLEVRKPDIHLEAGGGTFGEQIGKILERGERSLLEIKPDRFLVLGDTNSSLLAIMAKRLGIPVYHMEAGNRCYDDRVPEEVNRRIIDHSSDVLMPYSERSRANLLREGIPGYSIHVTGNPIYEVIKHYTPHIESSDVLTRMGVEKGRYFLVTLHRSENVDVTERLASLLKGLNGVSEAHHLPVICSLHPHTRARIQRAGLLAGTVRMMEPFGFFDFLKLEKNALCVLSDSGTVQEECCILQVPCVIIRDSTERPETVEAGSNVITGADPEMILNGVSVALGCRDTWRVPPEYLVENVSSTVAKIVLAYWNKPMGTPKW